MDGTPRKIIFRHRLLIFGGIQTISLNMIVSHIFNLFWIACRLREIVYAHNMHGSCVCLFDNHKPASGMYHFVETFV